MTSIYGPSSFHCKNNNMSRTSSISPDAYTQRPQIQNKFLLALMLLLPRGSLGFDTFLFNERRVNFSLLPIKYESLGYRRCYGYETPNKRTSLKMATSNNFSNEDPYAILDIPLGTTDKDVIKRAYRRMAMKYHPDVAVKESSNPEARKAANDRFIKINAAYELLSGKTSSQNGASSKTSSKKSSYNQPPHRRATSSTRTSTRDYTSDDWRDYIPNDYAKNYAVNDEEYNTDGDSFGRIFSDLINGIATGGSVAGGGVLNDLIEFLEGNYGGGFGVSSSARVDEDILKKILASENPELIRNEIDDTSLLIQQLETKLQNVETEIVRLEAEITLPSIRFLEREVKEEEIASLKARKTVVEDYLIRGRKRLIKLQTKLKEVRGRRSTSGNYASDFNSSSNSATSSTRHPESSNTSSGTYKSPNPKTGETSSRASSSESRDSFGTSGRGRGRSRRDSAKSSYTAEAEGNFSNFKSTQSTSFSSENTKDNVNRARADTFANDNNNFSLSPPHRRMSTSWKDLREDKKRMQELQVDDEFEKLKREMGL